MEWNRLGEALQAARMLLAGELVQSVPEQALLGCVSGIVAKRVPAVLNETA